MFRMLKYTLLCIAVVLKIHNFLGILHFYIRMTNFQTLFSYYIGIIYIIILCISISNDPCRGRDLSQILNSMYWPEMRIHEMYYAVN